MLVLSRKFEEWTEIRRKGRTLRMLIRKPLPGRYGDVEIVLDDPERNFEVERPERKSSHPEPR